MMLHVMFYKNESWYTYCIWPTNVRNDAEKLVQQLHERFHCPTKLVKTRDISLTKYHAVGNTC